MRFSQILTAAVAASGLAIAVAASADAPAPLDDPTAKVTLSADDVVGGRRAAYYLSGGLLSEMRMAVEHGADVKDQEFAAGAIALWARTLPHMFPAGTLTARSHANPNVWTDRPGFEAKAQVYAQEATKLREIAKTGDRAAFLAQIETLHQACDSCHHVYHKAEQPTDGKK